MERGVRKRIAIIGAGNVATHLAQALSKSSDIIQIYSRNIDNAQSLVAHIANAEAIDDITNLREDVDVYIVSVKDDAIAGIVGAIPEKCKGGLWVHTSGSVPMSVFADGAMECYGVLYPLQTFSRNVNVNVSEIPFFVEGNNAKVEDAIKELTLSMSPIVKCADSEMRRRIHIAAVYACNFANHMWTLADEVLKDGGLSFDVLLPLLKVSLEKVAQVAPFEAQTGPAKRGDVEVMNKHLELLDNEKAEIYKLLSQSIMNRNNIVDI